MVGHETHRSTSFSPVQLPKSDAITVSGQPGNVYSGPSEDMAVFAVKSGETNLAAVHQRCIQNRALRLPRQPHHDHRGRRLLLHQAVRHLMWFKKQNWIYVPWSSGWLPDLCSTARLAVGNQPPQRPEIPSSPCHVVQEAKLKQYLIPL